MIDLTSTIEKRNTDDMLDWVTAVSSKDYLDFMYSFMDSIEEDSEGKKEKLGMIWKLKLEMLTRKINDTDNTPIPFFLLFWAVKTSDKKEKWQ